MEYAFTDAIVRADREVLTARALQYLMAYAGEFHVLVSAKHKVNQGYELNIAEIRTVLNTMRADTSINFDYQPDSNVLSFPVPERRPRGIQFDDLNEDDYPSYKAFVQRYDTYPVREPRWRRHKKFNIKLPYGMSTVVRSEVIHLMSTERTEVNYYPIGSWHDGEKVFGQPKWEFRFYYECTQASKKLRMLTEHEAEVLVDLGLMRFCRTCRQFRDMRGDTR